MKKPIQNLITALAVLTVPVTAFSQLTVTNISRGCDSYHNFFLKSDGSLWGMGFNNEGQVGDGTSNNTNRPELILAGGVTAMASGEYHTLLLKSDGSLWAMGLNGNGELGDGTQNNANRPELIVSSGVTAIAAGGVHSLFLKSDGTLWGMGNNTTGQLGDGNYNNVNHPIQIASGVTAIAAGDQHSLFLKSDGSLWAMGEDFDGQLGDGSHGNPSYDWSTDQQEEIVASGVTAIAAGGDHSLFIKSDGSLWGMGDNFYGELGDGTFGNTNRPEQLVAGGVTAISAGFDHSLFIMSDGSLWAMGDNEYGQLGDGSYGSRVNRPEEILTNGVTAVTGGYYDTMFLKSDGSLWGVGYNQYGELGDGFSDGFPLYGTPFREQIVPTPLPALSLARSSQTNLQFNATCGFGGNFYLLASTNLAQPFNQWTPICTNSISSRGSNNYSVTLTNGFNPAGQQFYTLQSK